VGQKILITKAALRSFSAETSYNILAWTAERIHGKTKHLGVKKYMIVYDVPPQNGKARQQKREILRGVTKHEAESFLAKRIESVARGEYTAHADMTMSDLFDKFMTHKAKRLEATTIDRYKGIIATFFARRLKDAFNRTAASASHRSVREVAS